MWSEQDWRTSRKYIINKLLASIVRVRFGNNGYFKKSAEIDPDIQQALDALTSHNSGITFDNSQQKSKKND